jgi:hypothetical protein
MWSFPAFSKDKECRKGRDAGVHQVKERAGKRETSSAGRDRRMAGLEQGAAIRDEWMDNFGTDTPGSDRARHQMAPEDEPEGRSPDVPQCGAGPDEAEINRHP